MSSTYQCHKSCECENKSENWNVCHGCGEMMCDFANSDHGWEYQFDNWFCPCCVEELAPENGECDKCHKPLTGGDNNKWGSEHGEYKSLCDLCLDEEENTDTCFTCWDIYDTRNEYDESGSCSKECYDRTVTVRGSTPTESDISNYAIMKSINKGYITKENSPEVIEAAQRVREKRTKQMSQPPEMPDV